MRLCMTGLAAAVALGTMLPGCAEPTGFTLYGVGPNGAYPYHLPPVDREQAATKYRAQKWSGLNLRAFSNSRAADRFLRRSRSSPSKK